MAVTDDQQFCLRWNNFQANITSQFETLRDDEDFVDVTLACQGQKLEAHKVVLSACSPFFKELFKSNPCPHPIIFMRDVEARHVAALLEFMYAGEVNVCRTQLSDFLRTAESLQIRGLSDASKVQRDEELKLQKENEFSKRQNGSETLQINDKRPPKSPNLNSTSTKSPNASLQSKKSQLTTSDCNSRSQSPNLQGNKTQVDKRSEQYEQVSISQERSPVSTPPPTKRKCKTEFDMIDEGDLAKGRLELSPSPASTSSNLFANINASHMSCELDLPGDIIEPKTEPDYTSDDEQVMQDGRMDETLLGFEGTELGGSFVKLHGGMEIGPSTSMGEISQDSNQALSESRKLHSLDPRPCHLCGRVYSNLSNLRQHMRLIHHPQTVLCPICSKQFKTDLYMKRHLLLYHNDSSAVVEHRGAAQPLQQENAFFNSDETEHTREFEKDSSFICFDNASYHTMDASMINQI